jgi:hypothetical protein
MAADDIYNNSVLVAALSSLQSHQQPVELPAARGTRGIGRVSTRRVLQPVEVQLEQAGLVQAMVRQSRVRGAKLQLSTRTIAFSLPIASSSLETPHFSGFTTIFS